MVKRSGLIRGGCALLAATLAGCGTQQVVIDTEAGAITPVAALFKTTWASHSGAVNIDLSWYLPDGQQFADIERAGWGQTGAEAADMSFDLLPDGMHTFIWDMAGAEQAADIVFDLHLPHFVFHTARTVTGPAYAVLVVEVMGDETAVLFNGWLATDDPDAGDPSGFPTAEVQVGWETGTADSANVDITVYDPDGISIPVSDWGWSVEGFERITVPAGASLKDGTYQVIMTMSGGGIVADTAFSMAFPGLSYRADETLIGPARRTIGLDVTNGLTSLLFDGWAADNAEATGALSGRPLEANAGFSAAGEAVAIDISAQLPNGTYVPKWDNGWETQGFERAFLADESLLEDGTYELRFEMAGSGRTADVVYLAKLLGWEYSINSTLIGPANRVMGLDVTNGVATLLFDGWAARNGEPTGALSGRPLEANAGFSAAGEDVAIDVRVRLPNGSYVPKWDAGWQSQEFERAFLADSSVLTDGTYEFRFEMAGSGMTADVVYLAKLLGWEFSTNRTLIGPVEETIILEVVDGVVAEVTNTWNE